MAGEKRNLGNAKTRPTAEAFSPVTPASLKSGAFLGWFCLGIGVLAVGTWIAGPHLLGQIDRQDQSRKLDFLLFGPLAIPIGAYFFISNAMGKRKTESFQAQKQNATGQITHLWKAESSGDGSRCRIGYSFPEGPPAFQRVETSVFKSVSVGDEVAVEYLPENPAVSRLVLPGPPC